MKDTPFTADRLLALYDQVTEAEDAIPRLRHFVLDLAVRGKLVEQDPSEMAPKNGPMAVSNGAPYDLPGNWLWVRIGDQLELLNGMAFKPTDWKNEGLRIVRIQNLNNESASFNLCEPKEARERSIIDDGSFLISWSGTPGTSFGAFIWSRGRAVLNQHIFRCDFKTDAFSPDYLRLAINGRLDEMIAKAHGGVGLQHITKGKLEGMLIALPPLAEQQRIVAKVDDLMALCDQLEQARAGREAVRDRLTAATWARLTAAETDAETFPTHARAALQTLPTLTTRPDQNKTLRQTILNLAVRGKLVEHEPADEPAAELLKRFKAAKIAHKRETGDARNKLAPDAEVSSYPLELPKGWAVQSFENLFLFIDYRGNTPIKTDGGVPLITAKNVRMGSLNREPREFISEKTFKSWMTRGFPKLGDLFFTTEAPLANVCLNDIQEPFALAQRVICLQPYADISTHYLMLALCSDVMQSLIDGQATGMTAKGIKAAKLKPLPIPLPNLAEQHRIVARVDALMALCDRLESSLTNATTTRSRLFEALLHQALGSQTKAAA